MAESQILLWDDNPSDVDLLGFEDVAVPVLEALGQEHLDPVCVGIFGPWGCGKTTVLQLVQRSLRNDSANLVVYTQPWSYDPETGPKATLIGEVLNAVRAHIEDDDDKDRLAERLVGLAKRVRWSRVVSLAARSALTASLPELSDLERLFGEDDEVVEPTLQGFRDEFAGLLDDDAFSDLHRVVVVVDDLDRCLPGTVIETLEAIKLFLAVPKMAFVVAADEAPVAHAIATAFGDSPEGGGAARNYLEKIIQIPVRVPALGQSDVEAYVAQLLVWQKTRGNTELFESLRQSCADARAAGQATLVVDLANIVEGANADVALAERLAPILYEELAGNPRRIKRFLNAFWVRASIARRRGIDLEPSAFAKFVLLEELFPAEFRTMLGWLSDGTLEEKLERLEQGEGEFPAPLARWGKLDPVVSGPDAGRYLTLAAALQGATLATNSLPPELRDVATRLTSTSDTERRQVRASVDALDTPSRSLLAVHVADAIRFQPSRQAGLADSLHTVVSDSEVIASAAAVSLRRMPAADIQPALIVTLLPPAGDALGPFKQLVEEWVEDGALPEAAASAAALALNGAS